jgi:hypothetical protein
VASSETVCKRMVETIGLLSVQEVQIAWLIRVGSPSPEPGRQLLKTADPARVPRADNPGVVLGHLTGAITRTAMREWVMAASPNPLTVSLVRVAAAFSARSGQLSQCLSAVAERPRRYRKKLIDGRGWRPGHIQLMDCQKEITVATVHKRRKKEHDRPVRSLRNNQTQ